VRARALEEELTRSYFADEEGLVVKDLESQYGIGERNKGWFKVKHDTLNTGRGTQELYVVAFSPCHSSPPFLTVLWSPPHRDLIVLGGYYSGSARNQGKFSHFLLGLSVALKEGEVSRKDGNPGMFVTLGKVVVGRTEVRDMAAPAALCTRPYPRPPSLLFQTLDHIYDTYGTKYITTTPKNRGRIPPWIEPWKFKPDDYPDFWIRPQDSWLFEVMSAEVVPTTEFTATKTLRFPRVSKLRSDLFWHECASQTYFNEVAKDMRGNPMRTSRRGGHAGTKETPKKRKRTDVEFKVGAFEGSVEIDIFRGLHFVLSMLRGRESTVRQIVAADGGVAAAAGVMEDLQRRIGTHGGKVVGQTVPGRGDLCVRTSRVCRARPSLPLTPHRLPFLSVLSDTSASAAESRRFTNKTSSARGRTT